MLTSGPAGQINLLYLDLEEFLRHMGDFCSINKFNIKVHSISLSVLKAELVCSHISKDMPMSKI